MHWLSYGKTDAEIAALLAISPRTVHKHLEHIYVKLGVETRTAAVMRAQAMGRAVTSGHRPGAGISSAGTHPSRGVSLHGPLPDCLTPPRERMRSCVSPGYVTKCRAPRLLPIWLGATCSTSSSVCSDASPLRRRGRQRAGPGTTRASEPVVRGALPVPEVVEGNDHTDWDLWEDSVIALDSQMQSLSPSAKKIYARKDAPSQFDDLDVFSRVGKNRDL